MFYFYYQWIVGDWIVLFDVVILIVTISILDVIFYLFQKWAEDKCLLPAQNQSNKKMYREVRLYNTSFVESEGSVDEAGESTVGCWWNDVIGGGQNFYIWLVIGF